MYYHGYHHSYSICEQLMHLIFHHWFKRFEIPIKCYFPSPPFSLPALSYTVLGEEKSQVSIKRQGGDPDYAKCQLCLHLSTEAFFFFLYDNIPEKEETSSLQVDRQCYILPDRITQFMPKYLVLTYIPNYAQHLTAHPVYPQAN